MFKNSRLAAYQKRVKTVQSSIPSNQVWLFGTPPLIQYFSGFEFLVPNEREAFLVLTRNAAYLICGGFTPKVVLAFSRSLGIKPLSSTYKMLEHVKNIMAETKTTELLVDLSGLSAQELVEVSSLLPNQQLGFTISTVPTQTIHEMRLYKDDHEQECLRKAGAIIKQVMASVIKQLKTGITEIEVKALLEYELQKAGSLKPAFPTIIAFGEHAVEPHYQPSTTALEPGMSVLIDAGAVVDGYCSDMTRTVWFKGDKGQSGIEPDEAFLKTEEMVKESYAAAIAQLNAAPATTTAAKLDQVARDVFTTHAVGKYFIHTLGHGVGLEIHEFPSISSSDQTTLSSGMAITIEPGLYLPAGTLPGQHTAIGYRYENTCLITDSGVVELT